MDMDFYTLDSADDNVTPIYYVGADTLFAPDNSGIIKEGFPIFSNLFGESYGCISFDQETLKFEDTIIKGIAHWENAPLFEIKTTGGRILNVSAQQLIMCVNSDYSDTDQYDQFYESSIANGLDETTSIIIKDGESYKIDGVLEVNFIGEKPVYYVLSRDNNFVLANGAVLINY